ncbi:MAG: purine-nucleoside phosphorylase [Bacteroidota bacterium]|jgi:purine-nucleoside phosphorylase
MPIHLQESVSYILSKISATPKIALVLGSGLGDFGSLVKNPIIIPTKEIPNFPISTVQGHAGRLIFGKIEFEGAESPELLIFQGRIHFYECNDLNKVIYPVQIAHALGCETFFATNAAGGINRQFDEGTLMFIKDYINLTGENPLIHIPNRPFASVESPGFRKESFNTELLRKVKSIALTQKIRTKEGVYCWTKGPSYESGAEIRMMDLFGADAVGMSTVPEVIVANHFGMKVLGISCITNMGTGISPNKLSHDEVTETANRVKNDFTKLVSAILVHI